MVSLRIIMGTGQLSRMPSTPVPSTQTLLDVRGHLIDLGQRALALHLSSLATKLHHYAEVLSDAQDTAAWLRDAACCHGELVDQEQWLKQNVPDSPMLPLVREALALVAKLCPAGSIAPELWNSVRTLTRMTTRREDSDRLAPEPPPEVATSTTATRLRTLAKRADELPLPTLAKRLRRYASNVDRTFRGDPAALTSARDQLAKALPWYSSCAPGSAVVQIVREALATLNEVSWKQAPGEGQESHG